MWGGEELVLPEWGLGGSSEHPEQPDCVLPQVRVLHTLSVQQPSGGTCPRAVCSGPRESAELGRALSAPLGLANTDSEGDFCEEGGDRWAL